MIVGMTKGEDRPHIRSTTRRKIAGGGGVKSLSLIAAQHPCLWFRTWCLWMSLVGTRRLGLRGCGYSRQPVHPYRFFYTFEGCGTLILLPREGREGRPIRYSCSSHEYPVPLFVITDGMSSLPVPCFLPGGSTRDPDVYTPGMLNVHGVLTSRPLTKEKIKM